MTNLPECDYCDTTEVITEVDGKKTSNLKRIDDALVCPDCESRGIHRANQNAKATQAAFAQMEAAPININEVLRQSRDIDARIQVRTDLFNAATTAIVDLKKAIDDDGNIENKPFALATELTTRLNKYKQVVFELNEQIVDAQNNQRAIQQYLNQLANQLRAEEREKLKIQDINYKPGPVKAITPKQIRLTKKKYSTKEIREACAKNAINGIPLPEITVTMLLTAKQITLEQAIAQVKSSLELAQKSIPTTEAKPDENQVSNA